MSTPYTRKRAAQYRGPSTSDDYNQREKEVYNDLVVLYNRARLSEVEVDEFFRRIAKDQLSMTEALQDLEARINTLEGVDNRFTFYSENQLDTARFDGDADYAVAAEDRLTSDPNHGLLLLPRVDTSSLSKLFYTNTEGQEVIPSSFEAKVVGDTNTADNATSFIDSSLPEFALYRKPGVIWERNVVVDASHANGARLTLYVKVPSDLFTTDRSNAIVMHPFPHFGTTIESISYSTRVDPELSEDDNYVPLNPSNYYAGETAARGWIAPGGWTGVEEGNDTIVNAGPRAFYFKPQTVTALRIELHQADYYREDGKFIYSYGLSQLDLRYDKFLTEGKAFIRFDAPNAQTISAINDVQPQIWNVSPADLDNVFSYRTIWETSLDSGLYTETPVANSAKVWIEVTLTGFNDWVPALSGLTVDYS